MLDDYSLWLFAFAWFLAGVVNGISGMGAAMVALPIVAGSMSAQVLIPATCTMVPVISLACAIPYWRACRWQSLKHMLVTVVPGAVCGVAILFVMSPEALQLVAGPLMIAFVAWQFFTPRLAQHGDSWKAGGLTGFFAGFVNTSISFGNAPVAVYALWSGWGQNETRGTMNVFTTIVATTTCAVHALAGLYNADVLAFALVGAPSTVLGMLVAMPLLRFIDADRFRRILLMVLAAAGCVCIFRGLSGLLGG